MKMRSAIREASGYTLVQVMITVAVISIVSAFALLNINSTRASLRLQNSVRQLASYLEKARLDAIRRHANSSVVFTNATTYEVTMDFDGSGTVSTRTLPFENGVAIISTPLPSLTFNWRGRISACTVHFTVQNTGGEQSWVDVSDAGDVTVNSNVDITTTTATYGTVNTNSSVDSTAVVSGSVVHNNTLDCDGTSPPPSPTASIAPASIPPKADGTRPGWTRRARENRSAPPWRTSAPWRTTRSTSTRPSPAIETRRRLRRQNYAGRTISATCTKPRATPKPPMPRPMNC